MTSLRGRLTWFLALGFGAVLFAVVAAAYPVARQWLTGEFDAALLAKARALTALPEQGRSGINLAFTEQVPPEFARDEAPEYFQVWAGTHVIQARSPSLGTNSFPLRVGPETRPEHWALMLPDGRMGRAVGLGFSWDEGENKDGYDFAVVFARDTRKLQRTLRILVWSLIGGGLVLMVMMIFISGQATVAALRPLESLACEVTAVDAASLCRRFDTRRVPKEMQSVVGQLNRLLERLEAAFAREQRFAANAAHELLTPVSELRALAEAAAKWRDDPEATARFGTDVCETASQMEQTIRALLVLARPGTEGIDHCEPIDISAQIGELRESVEKRSKTRRLELDWMLTSGVIVLGNEVLCRAIISNLLENAVDHAPEDGRIECVLRKEENDFSFTITNTNPGLTVEDLPQLDEPFWRKDSARTDRVHAGLGLALVRLFAQRVGWKLSISLPEKTLFEARLQGKTVIPL